ncbi:MAG: nuclear transport factor 2 family protein [Actinomycetota bacterium]|nr:nuclear transport factor 2 family protein [Actinomycetota bacterium]
MSDEPAATGAVHPARAASHRSMAAVGAQDKAAWLALFAAGACVEDPVGPSFLDKSGAGHRGRDAIAAFYDATIAGLAAIAFDITDSFAAGQEVANVGTITMTFPTGGTARCEGVFVYRVDDDGLIVSLRAFWEVDRMMATMS